MQRWKPAAHRVAAVLAATMLAATVAVACAGSATAPPAVVPPAPTTTSVDPAAVEAAARQQRQPACRRLRTAERLGVLQQARAIAAGTSGQSYRDAIADTFEDAARQVEAASASGDAALFATGRTWAEAKREVARYIRTTVPQGDNVVEFGPGNDRERAGRSEAERLCGGPFV